MSPRRYLPADRDDPPRMNQLPQCQQQLSQWVPAPQLPPHPTAATPPHQGPATDAQAAPPRVCEPNSPAVALRSPEEVSEAH